MYKKYVSIMSYYGHYSRETVKPNNYYHYDDNIKILSFSDTLDACLYESLINYNEYSNSGVGITSFIEPNDRNKKYTDFDIAEKIIQKFRENVSSGKHTIGYKFKNGRYDRDEKGKNI
jgi:hypothetical protein